jgi:hypothetical protein
MRKHWSEESEEENEIMDLAKETIAQPFVIRLVARIARRQARVRDRNFDRMLRVGENWSDLTNAA